MGVDQAIDITADERKTVLALLKRHLPGTAAWVYGSRAKWTSRPQSDLDLVVFATPEQRRHVGDLREAFEESNLPFRVDLFVWDDVPHSFRARIDAEHVPLARPTPRSCPDGWTQTRLGNVITLKRGYDLPARDRRNGPVPVVSSSGITDHHSDSKVSGPGVVTGRYGTLGQVYFVPNDFWPLNTALYVRDFKGNDPRFISYFLRSLDFSSFSDKAAVPGLNRNHLHEEAVRVPGTLAEQRTIAHILGTLDDKIELNRRMNATLEAMARALFRSWFVDFDPVRDKMEGRDPGLPKDIADLFPDRMVESELGEIPRGWMVRTLGDLCHKPQYGYTASANGEPVGPQFLRITDINKESWVSWSRVPYCEATNAELLKYRLNKGEVLIARMADPGHGILVEEDVEAVFASYLIRFKPIETHHARLLQYWLKSDAYWQLVTGQAAGTTRVSLNARVLSQFPLVVPPDSVASAFAEAVGALRDRLVRSARETESLAALRDTLLPKLVSGELRL